MVHQIPRILYKKKKLFFFGLPYYILANEKTHVCTYMHGVNNNR